MSGLPIILASQSPARLALLKQVGITPDKIIAADIDESSMRRELPLHLATRLALAKANKITNQIEQGIVIAADTVVATGRKILPKALNNEDIKDCLQELSGRRHRVYTGVCVIRKLDGQLQVRQKLVQTVVKFKNLTNQDIAFYCDLGEGLNKAGGYALSGFAESFVIFLSGSHSNVIGLPLYETLNMLNSLKILTER
ncbi:Maf-like protein [Candidatus Trichorickettsia mobilis]|uniref:Nucleoside triphosphate pyrophosphatase n=1 Tax=Candidatus Trichorickettsia mobilis TaxID=1346319 RepID=A0ABZ0UVS8_9RICK|nr:nucleoside triphosphate pyrophosphatase [Candidatus Trichorickettsia mobilis]WPY00134.1 Maf-like protein [Candidatus Trichorickettsia mobilis]